MSLILAVVDDDGNLIENCAGFYEEADLRKRFATETIVQLIDVEFPKGFDPECYRVISGKFVKKSDAEIEDVMTARRAPRKSPFRAELHDIDPAAPMTDDSFSTVVKFLQSRYDL